MTGVRLDAGERFLPRRWVESALKRSFVLVTIRSAGTGSAYLSLCSTHVAWNPEMFHGVDPVCREEYGLCSRYRHGGEGLPAVKAPIYFAGDCTKHLVACDWNNVYTASLPHV